MNALGSPSETVQIASATLLTPTSIGCLQQLIDQPVVQGQTDLLGRSAVTRGELPGFGRVVIKHYTRGGLLGRINRRTYLRSGEVRSKLEYERLRQVRICGIPAPEPIAYAWQGGILYRAWLVTKEIEGEVNLATLCRTDEDAAERAVGVLTQHVRELIKQGILHVDLHPGNVLLDQNGQIYLIDFDKCRDFHGSMNQLRDCYLCRWRRAVTKHKLPDTLSEVMSLGLRQSFGQAYSTGKLA